MKTKISFKIKTHFAGIVESCAEFIPIAETSKLAGVSEITSIFKLRAFFILLLKRWNKIKKIVSVFIVIGHAVAVKVHILFKNLVQGVFEKLYIE